MRSAGRVQCVIAVGVAVVVVLTSVGAWALSARTLYHKGKDRLSEGKSDMALLYFRELIREHPHSSYAVEAHFLVARYYMESRNYFQADRALREHLSTYPESPYADQVLRMLAEMEVLDLEARASKAMREAEYRAAKVLWEDVLAKNPNHAMAKANLAECERIIERMDFQKRQLEREKERIEAETPLKVICVELLDERDRVFSPDCPVFDDDDERQRAHEICRRHGEMLCPDFPLGYDDSQALIAFEYQTPNNSLPVLWSNAKRWMPIFERRS